MAELRKVVDVVPTVPTLADLRAADEVFVASATRPILPVHVVLLGDDELELPAPGPVTSRVRTAFDHHIEATLDPLP